MGTSPRTTDAILQALALVAPGTPLRDGLDRIVRAKMGALLVLSDGPAALEICSGGFIIDAPFSPQRLSELAKMDGAIILSGDCGCIARANVHLVPDASVATVETGTRHRTAERVARSLHAPVVSVSEEMSVINLYVGDRRHQLQEVGRLLDRANQALQTLVRYRLRLDVVLNKLTALEVEDVATVRDAAAVVKRAEMVLRIAAELETMVVELGVDARLLRLQLDELHGEIDQEIDTVIEDYVQQGRSVGEVHALMTALVDDEVVDVRRSAEALGLGVSSDDLEQSRTPRGLRMLARVPRLPSDLVRPLAAHFGGLDRLQRATIAELMAVPGVSQQQADDIKETVSRVVEASIMDQYN